MITIGVTSCVSCGLVSRCFNFPHLEVVLTERLKFHSLRQPSGIIIAINKKIINYRFMLV